MAEKYVVLHSMIAAGKFVRGDVAKASDLGEALDRFLDLGAVRPALPDEAVLERVNLDEPKRPNLSFEAMVADRDREIVRLRGRVRELEDKLAAAHKDLDELLGKPE